MRWLLPLIPLSACYAVPESLPPFDGVPLQGTQSCAPTRSDRVACVLDGDTFDIGRCGDDEVGERVRLLGIDAPELAHEGTPAECYGDEATRALDDLIGDSEVVLEFDETCVGEFGRTLAWVFVTDAADTDAEPVNVSLALVERGYARLYTEFEFDRLRYANQLTAAERSAQAARVGLWDACVDQ
jgi:endonuclease YncB( thermonuclease family)